MTADQPTTEALLALQADVNTGMLEAALARVAELHGEIERLTAAPVAAPQPRFFIDHETLHDRKTGLHWREREGYPATEDCDALNAMESCPGGVCERYLRRVYMDDREAFGEPAAAPASGLTTNDRWRLAEIIEDDLGVETEEKARLVAALRAAQQLPAAPQPGAVPTFTPAMAQEVWDSLFDEGPAVSNETATALKALASGHAIVVENRAAEVAPVAWLYESERPDFQGVTRQLFFEKSLAAKFAGSNKTWTLTPLCHCPPPAADHTALLKRADEWLDDASGWLDEHTGGMLHRADKLFREFRDALGAKS